MFLKRHDHATTDLSIDVRESQYWKPAALRSWEHLLNVSALAFEPICGLLAVGTSDGNIVLLGRPGVEVTVTLPDPLPVKSLQISAFTSKLVCLDVKNQLHIWDLSHFGRPKYLVSAKYDQANSLTISPSHAHAFICLQSGEIRTYDLACLRKSPFTMPNMWALYAEKMAASGLSEASNPTSRIAFETVVHPRDLNLLFIVYGGGIVLSDLTARNTLRVFELVLPPGAPGGFGYGAPDILTQRRPEVTCMAIHPSGHLFAVGHADGSIAFWAVEDEDQPVSVRTLDDIDVHTVNAVELESRLSEARGPDAREPIFKLAWCSFPNSSDSRGGDTALVVLGGLGSTEASGVTVYWLPAFNPPEPPVTASTSMHPSIRAAMRDSSMPSKSYFYYVDGTVQDFLLVPRNDPHFSGANDPITILLTREGAGGSRVVDAFQFPPPVFRDSEEETGDQSNLDKDNTNDTLADLASTLQAMKVDDDPQQLQLPGYLSNASKGMIGGDLYRLDRDAYQKVTEDDGIKSEKMLPLKAGFAWCDQKESGMTKYQPTRLLVTRHANLSVQMWDVSPQLLLSVRPTPIQYHFPHPLLKLEIDVTYILSDPVVLKNMSGGGSSVQSVELTPETLDCAIVLTTGEVVIEGLLSNAETRPSHVDLVDKELTSLRHLPALSGSKYSPLLLLAPLKGSVLATAMADLGLLAVAYEDGSLYAIDVIKSRVILRLDTKEKRHSSILSFHTDKDPINQLLWTLSPTSTDLTFRVRLIAAHESGSCQVFTFIQGQEWVCNDEPHKLDIPSHPIALFVLDKKNGARCHANRRRLNDSHPIPSNSEPRTFFVAAGSKGARVHSDIDGHRVGKVDWNSKMGKILSVQVVERLGSFALVAFTEHQEACAYSLPDLEFMHNLSLPVVSSLPLSVDDTGDFIAWGKHPGSGIVQRASYGTLFDFHRVNTLPAVDLMSIKPVIPAQPQLVSIGPASLLGSWFKFGASTTGEQIDALLGGPDRPKISSPKTPASVPQTNEERAKASQMNAEAAAAQSSLYSRLTSALEERGQMLGDLEDRFNVLEQGSRSMVDQAKRLAAEQTTKSWFKFS
ncbi:WD40 containing snare-dependent exocytosis protein [Dendrothele bispora CBS 962.96]|uniref:WD40 containing snare-dependent exocytosis protein n=1 Tax=Dendrothele bispora (strain CBS 962.96) TaxID=1314807 RepID=A0A4V4HIP4_DENBC|nr:WD40 containing snare-dependent exocytosis protein [Dendrothele bispora CBS 962.96]